MDKIYSVEEIKQIVAPIAKMHGAEKVYLFGSYCKGLATEKSDIDFRIDKGSMTGFFSIGSFLADLEDAFGKKIDVCTTESLSPAFRENIEGEEILIYHSGL